MLAQNFKSADELDIPEAYRDALIKTLVLMETGKMVHVKKEHYSVDPGCGFSGYFNMGVWNGAYPCGTVACIGGTAEMVGGIEIDAITRGLDELFYASNSPDVYLSNISVEKAAVALRNYLTTGAPNWDLVGNNAD